jgi:hypothetical protein
MSSLVVATRSEGAVGADVAFQARLISKDGSGAPVANEGNCITQADVQTITCTVYDLQAGKNASTPVATPSIDPTAVVALIADNLWQARDTIGRNFLHQVAGSVFGKADHTYRVVYEITTTGGSNLKWAHEHQAIAMRPAS